MADPLVRGGDAVAALEYWTKPAKPAVHPDQAEYVIVVAGDGTMVSGGRLIDPVTTNPTLIEGSRIEAGTTRPLHTGDVFLIPARHAALVRHHRRPAGAARDEDRAEGALNRIGNRGANIRFRTAI